MGGKVCRFCFAFLSGLGFVSFDGVEVIDLGFWGAVFGG